MIAARNLSLAAGKSRPSQASAGSPLRPCIVVIVFETDSL
jgi:hypothetical protein